jgi:hypothetical protein
MLQITLNFTSEQHMNFYCVIEHFIVLCLFYYSGIRFVFPHTKMAPQKEQLEKLF